ncbi:hypothetical protein A1O7_10044 [Cladophialophora yegresii CBS 114405]|uniref:Uncharacterized protein n=1 Tax=Cladophialophora yegresii CBS 114405 TaxID=1182544 RepID=W9VGS8_9EURO|nr:uncharacterized protein A1O7_10044 [Cladophialophora yegresii CBS 114405]EXJ54703.1 hypothetical protein A1O7_10044 [Cladophialophora yegresii CBS 114405]
MNYLIVDVAQKQFRLSEASRQDWGNEGGVFPKTLCPATPPASDNPENGTTVNPGPSPEPEPEPKPKPKPKVGALVGEIVGPVVGVAIIALAIFFCWRRRRRNRRRREQASASQPDIPTVQTYQPVPPMGQHPSSTTWMYTCPHQHQPPQGSYSYTDQPFPPAGAYPVMMQHGYPKADQTVYQPYTPPPHRAPQEMPSPEPTPAEWRGSEVSGDTGATVSELASLAQPQLFCMHRSI